MDELPVMDSADCIDVELIRFDNFAESCLSDPSDDVLGPFRAFERWDQEAAAQFGLGVVQRVVFAEDG